MLNIRMLLVTFSILLVVSTASAQIPYSTFPDWSSSESSDYGTGCDLADINGNGWLDLAVSNGNDMAMAPNYVYTNNMGMLPTSASWSSENIQFSGHCELADIDSDGYPEFMVTNYISPGWEPGSIQIYDNIGGVLETTPSWETEEPVYSFRATFGDPDGDGDLDLAVATGEAYHAEYFPSLIFFNENGVLSTTPGWTSDDSDAAYDVQFVDIDNDGDQDLAVLTSSGPVKIYMNEGGQISTLPGWQTDDSDNGNTFDFADLNGDGWLDLGVANNTQLGGSGYFHIFFSQNGVLSTQPDWSSETVGYGRRLMDTASDTLDLEGGVGLRQNKLSTGDSETEAVLRGAVDYLHKFSKTSEFHQGVLVLAGEDNTSVDTVSAIKANIIGNLALEVAFKVKHNTDPPADKEETDTATSLSLVYGF